MSLTGNVAVADLEIETTAPPVAHPDSATELIGKLVKKIESISTELVELRKFARVTERAVVKIEREVVKAHRKTKRAAPSNSVPSGFRLPVKILPKLTMFLNDMRIERGESAQGAGEMIARTEVTRFLTAYVKSNALQDPNEPRLIVLNSTLASLFDLSEGERITWFNMQTFLKPLYDQSDEAKCDNDRVKKSIAAERVSNKAATVETVDEGVDASGVEESTADKAAPKAKRSKTMASDAEPTAPVGETPIAKGKKTAAKKLIV